MKCRKTEHGIYFIIANFDYDWVFNDVIVEMELNWLYTCLLTVNDGINTSQPFNIVSFISDIKQPRQIVTYVAKSPRRRPTSSTPVLYPVKPTPLVNCLRLV